MLRIFLSSPDNRRVNCLIKLARIGIPAGLYTADVRHISKEVNNHHLTNLFDYEISKDNTGRGWDNQKSTGR